MTLATFTQAVATPQTTMGARFWVTRIVHGLLLGGAITILQSGGASSGWTIDFVYYFPVVSAPNEIGLSSFVSSLLVWCGEGILLALAVGLAERWVRPHELSAWQLALTVLVGAVAAVLIWQTFTLILLRDALGVRLVRDHVGTPVIWIGGVLYHSWLMLFFGGLAAAVYASQRWRARMLATLRATELGRATSQQYLSEARLVSLEARIDPDYMFQTLIQLEQLYETDPGAADRLLDEFIAFLRNALTGIHGPTSSSAPAYTKVRGGGVPEAFIVKFPTKTA